MIARGVGCKNNAFITKAKSIHGDKYDYSHVEYVNNRTKVTIICREHGPFEQTPNNHLMGQKCPSCTTQAKHHTTKQFAVAAHGVHGDTYDYSSVEYVGSNSAVNIVCKTHGVFTQLPSVHLRGHGCPSCGNRQKSSTNETFVSKAHSVHGDKYDYSRVMYKKASQKVQIICYAHGVFNQAPSSHLMGNGCPRCAQVAVPTLDDITVKAQAVHGDRYDYSQVEYFNAKTKILICCREHGPFKQRLSNHLAGNCCPKCVAAGRSKKALDWLTQLSKEQNINIQHAGNDGEFKIPGTKWKADGYCAETNTIYEFHGDAFHGNLGKYAPSSTCHPFNKSVTALELYERTLFRDEEIRRLGYGLVVSWEADYDTAAKQKMQSKVLPARDYTDE